MTVKFIHTSDWHVGQVFRFVDDGTMGLLQNARLNAIKRIGDLAREHAVRHVLVAGDVYDMEGLAPRSLNQPLEGMRQFAKVHWHLLPGNHDPYRANGLWDQLFSRLPDNVHVYRTREPALFAQEGFALLPAPLRTHRALEDPTADMDKTEVAGELVRVGLAHGSVTSFGSAEHQTPNLIPPDRPERAGLAYLALGDWHGQKKVGERCWYSGTPETDDFATSGGGRVLLVEIESRRAPPVVTSLPSGEYTWLRLSERVDGREDIDALEEKLRALPHQPGCVLVRLRLEGTVSLEDRQYLRTKIAEGVGAGFRFLAIDDDGLVSRPTAEDLDRIDRGGFVRAAAETLQQKAEQGNAHEREIAERALQRLYLEHRKLQGLNR